VADLDAGAVNLRFTLIYQHEGGEMLKKTVVFNNAFYIPSRDQVIKKARLNAATVGMILIGDPDELK
jgi:hypothetical protein